MKEHTKAVEKELEALTCKHDAALVFLEEERARNSKNSATIEKFIRMKSTGERTDDRIRVLEEMDTEKQNGQQRQETHPSTKNVASVFSGYLHGDVDGRIPHRHRPRPPPLPSSKPLPPNHISNQYSNRHRQYPEMPAIDSRFLMSQPSYSERARAPTATPDSEHHQYNNNLYQELKDFLVTGSPQYTRQPVPPSHPSPYYYQNGARFLV